jgi:WD40 repeat protein
MTSFASALVIVIGLSGIASAQEAPKLELDVRLGHTQHVWSAALSSNGKYVATGSHDSTAILWDVATGRNIRTFDAGDWIEWFAFSADDKRLVTGDRDMRATLWDVATGKQLPQ